MQQLDLQPAPRRFRGQTWRPRSLHEYHVELEPGKRIVIWGQMRTWKGRAAFSQRYRVGDWAYCDGPGYRVFGRITSIGRKVITIEAPLRTYRLNLWQFVHRNAGADIAALAEVDEQ